MKGGLTARAVIASAVIAVTVGASFVFSLAAISAQRDWEHRLTGSLQELALVDELEKLVVDLETGVRGFLITHEEQFLEPWDQARVTFPDRAAELAALTDDPVEDPLTRDIIAAVESYIADYAAPLVDAARRDDPAAFGVASATEGKQRVDAIRAQFDLYRNLEAATLAQRRDNANDASHRAILAATGGLVGSLLLITVFAGYIARAIVMPIRRTAAMAVRLAGGDLATRLPETASGEIGSLDRSFNVMARSLEASRDHLTTLLEEQAALRRVATLVARGVPPAETFAAVADAVAGLIGAETAAVLRFELDGAATFVVAVGRDAEVMPVGARWAPNDVLAATAVLRSGHAMRVDDDFEGVSGSADGLRQRGVRSVVASPILVEGHLWGAILATTKREPLPPDTEQRLASFVELVATAIANAASRAELIASRARVVAAADDTRRRIERDLHDGIQQRLVSIGLELRVAQQMVPPGVDDLSEQLSRLARDLNDAVEGLQEVSRGIHPAILSRGGLGAALRTLARRSALPVEVELGDARRLPERIEVALYYVASEALTNAAKHAGASVVHVDLETDEATVQLSIGDDGVGGADPTRGSGLVGLRDRIEALGGSIEVASPAGGGTSLVVRIPLDQG